MNQEFAALMNRICTELLAGEIYHSRAANEFRKIALRGFGRWAESEARGDMNSRVCLEKLLRDKLGFAPTVDTSSLSNEARVAFANISELPSILQKWIDREKEFSKILTQAMKMAAEIDVEIYRELIELTNEVQTEVFRVKLCGVRLELAGWNGHDLGIVSTILHEHFEKHPDDKYVNVNLG